MKLRKDIIAGLMATTMFVTACGAAKTEPEQVDDTTTAVTTEVEETKEENTEATEETTETPTEAETTTESADATENAEFFVIRQITSVSDEMPEGIYSDEPDKSATEDLERRKKDGCEMYAETWPSISDDYKDIFPYTMFEGSIEFTKNGETFDEMINRVGPEMRELFIKDAPYAGHEDECVSYMVSPNGKRACMIFYEAKEQVAYIFIFNHVAHDVNKKGETTDWYFKLVTGERISKITSADDFYKNLEKLGVTVE